jgi:hypothetical protein
VNWRFLRHLLIVLGAYFLANVLHGWLQTAQTLLHLGDVTYRDGILGLIKLHVVEDLPVAIAAVFGTILIWYAMGPALARRWMWGLASVFALVAVLQVMNARRMWEESRGLHAVIAALMPAIACLVTGLVLQRLLPDGPGQETVPDEPTPRKGRTIVLAAAWSMLPFAVGGVIGVAIMAKSTVRDLGPSFAAVMESGNKALFAEAQFREGKYNAAKTALEDFGAYLERIKPSEKGQPWQPGQAPFLDAKGIAFDRMGTYARLAINEERAQHADEAAAYWTRAEEQARLLDWKDPTRETIRKRLAGLMDANGPIRRAGASPGSDPSPAPESPAARP